MAEAPPNGPTSPFPPDPLRTVLTCAVPGVVAWLTSNSILTGAVVTGSALVASWAGYRADPRP